MKVLSFRRRPSNITLSAPIPRSLVRIPASHDLACRANPDIPAGLADLSRLRSPTSSSFDYFIPELVFRTDGSASRSIYILSPYLVSDGLIPDTKFQFRVVLLLVFISSAAMSSHCLTAIPSFLYPCVASSSHRRSAALLLSCLLRRDS